MNSGPTNVTAKARATSEEPIRFERGSGNVFADLDVPNPDLALAKAELVQRIRRIIVGRKLAPAKAATMLGLDQPQVSALLRGRTGGYSIERLFRFLNALGQSVEITIRPAMKADERCAFVVM